MSVPEEPVIILVRPQLGENIGMVARAMRNFALSQLRIVAPRDGWSADGAVMQAAFAAAVGAGEIIEQAALFSSINEAVTDLAHVYATTARERGQGKPVVAPAQEMPLIRARLAAGQGIGILFGPERTGLTNDEVSLASSVMSFPVNPAFASLNLAQAVLLVAYDWFRSQTDMPPIRLLAAEAPANRNALLSFFDDLEERLKAAGYFREEAKQALMMRNLRNILHRLDASDQDVKTLRGVIRTLSEPRAARQETESR
jgi:tRNA/rRNA methyltransferase